MKPRRPTARNMACLDSSRWRTAGESTLSVRRLDHSKGSLHFTCGRCGLEQPFNEVLEQVGHGAPVAAYAIQGYCPECDAEGQVYDGRFFAAFSEPDQSGLVSAEARMARSPETPILHEFWPTEEIAYSYMTHHANFALPKQGYTHWWKMFNSRQLLVHSRSPAFGLYGGQCLH